MCFPRECLHCVVITWWSFQPSDMVTASTVHRAYRDAAPMLEAVRAGHATPILHPFHATPAVSQKQMAGTLIKTPKSLKLSWTHMETMGNMMHTCNNCKEHTVWVRIGLANVVHRHHPNFYGFAAPETVAQVMASLIPRNVVNQTIANSLLNIVSYKIYILLIY